MKFAHSAPWSKPEGLRLHSSIDRHLEEIDSLLLGFVTDDERAHFMNETAYWVEQQARDFTLAGMTYELAAERAVREHGSAKFIANQLIEEVFEKNVNSPLYDKLGRSNCIAAAFFGCGNALYLFLLQMTVYFPSGDPNKLPFTPAEIRNVLPDPIPFPELSWQYGITVGYPIFAPFIYGWLCGRLIPVHAARAAMNAMLFVILSAFLLGSLLLPNTSGLLYGVFQTLFWLPVGCTMAHFSSSYRRLRRRKLGNRLTPIPLADPNQEVIS